MRRLSLFLVLVLAAALVPASGLGHGGYPFRLGVQQTAELEALTEIVRVYLGEGFGMSVQPEFFESAEDLQKSLEEGKVDMALEYPAEVWIKVYCPTGAAFSTQATEKIEEYYQEKFPGAWVGLFSFSVSDSPCFRPGVVVFKSVLEDLRFSLLRPALEKLLRAVEFADLEQYRREIDGKDRRGRVDAARKLLIRKGLL